MAEEDVVWDDILCIALVGGVCIGKSLLDTGGGIGWFGMEPLLAEGGFVDCPSCKKLAEYPPVVLVGVVGTTGGC